jgi:hypothetical protein
VRHPAITAAFDVSKSFSFCFGCAVLLMNANIATVVRADNIYSNDFQNNTEGFTAFGTSSSLTLTSLPTDSGGLGSESLNTEFVT